MKKRLKGLPRVRVSGVLFRCVYKIHSNEVMDIRGSVARGGRYNTPGEFGALYLSDSELTSRNEVKRSKPFAQDSEHPVFRVRVDVGDVLDLTDPLICKKLLLRHNDDLLNTDYINTQALGRAARAEGFKAIKAPSATGSGWSLVVFTDRLDARDVVDLVSSQ